MDFQEYPKALYRGEEVRIVDGKEAETEARGAGWRLSIDPLDHDGDGKKGGSRRKTA